jgi:riboflavin kinase/FMN adenylyltransferase
MKIFHTLPDSPEQSVALTIGNFDGVHRGHQAMISLLKEEARTRNLPACVLTFEPHPREFLHPRNAPRRLTNLTEKAALLEGVGIDHLYVCAFDEHIANMPAALFVSRVLVAQLAVRWLLVGDDFRFGERRLGDLDLLRRHAQAAGFEVEAMRTVSLNGDRVSSTAVRDAYAQRDAARMAALLGRPQLLRSESGGVPSGDRSGSSYGYSDACARI